jgi:hypothetical protein
VTVVKFYRDGLGFEVLSEFKDHDGFDGVMLGRKGAAYHLEFTRKAGHKAGRAPTEDNALHLTGGASRLCNFSGSPPRRQVSRSLGGGGISRWQIESKRGT